MSGEKEGLIELSSAIANLRDELLTAQHQGNNKEIRFKVEEIDLDLSVAATKTGGVEAGVKFWVIDAKAKGEVKSESIMKVRLKLKPMNSDGGSPVLVSDRVPDPSV
ncbi:MAG: hypothetical protein HQL81_00315 [Magnetococcales bacterium]|nr:hypothetical protein [Magnetococcales bacterium]